MGTPYIGEIRMFGGNFAPAGWAFCNGQLLAIAENDALFALIGTTYGGDGEQTFALPDLRGRLPLHITTGYPLGQAGGSESVTLTLNQIPNHSHIPQASSQAGGASDPTGNVWAGSSLNQFTTDVPTVPGSMNSGAIAAAGGGQPHENMMPYLTVSFIISLFGIFPSQS